MATRVTITKALEAKIRSAVNPKKEGEWHGEAILREIIDKLDDEQGKREAGAAVSEAQTGLGYKALVSLFRSFLGDSLLTPPKPGPPFIVKIINKAKEQGIDSTNVEQAIRGLSRLSGRGPHRLADLVYNYDRYYAAGQLRGGSEEAPGVPGVAEAEVEVEERVYSGRLLDS